MDNQSKPDLEFYLNNQRHLLDVSWVGTDGDPVLRFNEKIKKYSSTYQLVSPENIIPLIINYGIILKQSAELLDKHLKEIKPEVLYKIIYREIAKSWYFPENLTQINQRIALENHKIQRW